MQEIDVRVSKARAALIMSPNQAWAFMASLVMRLIVVERRDIKTLATDGKYLFYCKAFLDTITEMELIFCIAHEALHCALGHMTRRGTRRWDLWQAATDYVVNLMLRDAGFTVPEWVKYFDEKYRDLNVEQVYKLLEQEEQDQQQDEQPQPNPQFGQDPVADQRPDPGKEKLDKGRQGSIDHMPDQNEDDRDAEFSDDDEESDPDPAFDDETEGEHGPVGEPMNDMSDMGNPDFQPLEGEEDGTDGSQPGQGAGQNFPPSHGDPGGCGEVLDAAPPQDQAKLDEMADEWQVFTRQAANVARRKGEGRLPGFAQTVIGQLDEPKHDWREAFHNFVDPQSNTKDYSWTNPSRRMISLGYFVPGMISDGLHKVGLFVDNSGSIDIPLLKKFGGEAQSALDDGKIDRIVLVVADDGINFTAEYEKGDIIDLSQATGGGGTAFSPTFKWVEGNVPDLSVAVYFTDLDCSDFGPEPTYPVLWACYENDPKALKARMERVPFGECIALED